MIIHKVNNCSRGIHTTIFKIKTILIQTIKENVTCAKIGHPNCSQIRIKIAKKKKKGKGKVNIKSFFLEGGSKLSSLFHCPFNLRWTVTLDHLRSDILVRVLKINHIIVRTASSI